MTLGVDYQNSNHLLLHKNLQNYDIIKYLK